jgi:sporulation protein YlmC with PRC-barrel domain
MRTQAEQLLGARVTGSDGKLIGTVEQVFRDDVDGKPAWARVRVGKTVRFVPLGTSQVTADGLSVPFESQKVMNGPNIEAGQHMSAAQAGELSRYYELTVPAQQAPGQQAPSQQVPSQQVPSQQDAAMLMQAEQLLGVRVTDSDGKVTGTVEQVFRDDVDGTPAWARVRVGRTGRFVPLGTSQVTGEGLRVPFDSQKVLNSPDIDAGPHMSAAQCDELSRYYGLIIPAQQAPREQAPGQQAPGQQAPAQRVPAQQVPSQQGAGMPTDQDVADARTAERDSGGDVTTRTQAEQLLGARAAGADGKVIGTIEQVFRDDVDGTPAWARIRSAKTARFVPLGTSQVTGEGLRVPFDSQKVLNSPDIDAGPHMSAAQCEELSRYYGLIIPAQPREQAPGQQAPGQQAPGQGVSSQDAGKPTD